MDEGILSLKWNNHNSTFIHTLSTLHKMEMYSDVTLACEGKYFSVHKLVLSICSEYFEEILSRTKCQHPVVVLKDIKHNDLEALLNYMYAGEANVAQSELANLIKAAECLRIKGLAVPDETPPVRDKRRHLEHSESPQYCKKRRSEETIDSTKQTLKEYDSSNNRLLDSSKSTLKHDDPAQIFGNERQNSKLIQDRDNNKRIPEIVLEGQPVEVKQEVAEPKIEEHEDTHQNLDDSNLQLDYNMNLGGDESNESGRHGHDSQTSHIIQDLMAHSLPGPSGVQGHETIGTWESPSTNNLSSFSVENYSSDEGRTPQMGDAVSSSFLGEGGGGGGFLGSDLLLSTLGAGTTSPGGPAGGGIPAQHPCHCCPKRFLTRQDLRRHLRTHTGERPFKCFFCPYRAALKGNVKKHVLSVHKTLNSGDKPSIAPSQLLAIEFRDAIGDN